MLFRARDVDPDVVYRPPWHDLHARRRSASAFWPSSPPQPDGASLDWVGWGPLRAMK